MTATQWRMLETLAQHNGETMEVLLEWAYDGDTEAGEAKAWNTTTCLFVAGLVRSLVKKGYATDDANGYGVTDAGRAVLERHRQRQARMAAE